MIPASDYQLNRSVVRLNSCKVGFLSHPNQLMGIKENAEKNGMVVVANVSNAERQLINLFTNISSSAVTVSAQNSNGEWLLIAVKTNGSVIWNSPQDGINIYTLSK